MHVVFTTALLLFIVSVHIGLIRRRRGPAAGRGGA